MGESTSYVIQYGGLVELLCATAVFVPALCIVDSNPAQVPDLTFSTLKANHVAVRVFCPVIAGALCQIERGGEREKTCMVKRFALCMLKD